MPHYADGSEATVGDQVTGVLYNSGPAPKAGVIISITPGVESCNAMVQYTEAVAAVPHRELSGERLSQHISSLEVKDTWELPKAPRMARRDEKGTPVHRMVRGEQHGSGGATFALFECTDYTETKQLTKVG